ncbi:MAG: glutamate--tRNA ligase [Lentimicrobiaceae bacterium]|nr:glutamate--tRNA ligase [Lentimicrobiaceae bacterium]
MREIRVRFAPSPTGPLHIGGVRTALYNYLFAKQNNGKFILRIEDTDQTRFVEGAEQYINESFDWLGIPFDESPEKGGKYAPYKQSERKDIYVKYAQQLIDSGHAYYAFDTPEQLNELRNDFEKKGETFQYGINTRASLNNSLNMSESQLKETIDSGVPYVIRVKIPENITVNFTDMIRGDISVDSNQLDDKVLFKSDGLPTYHLANIVDDYLMKISHVIRGEEWLPSAPLHVLLYEFLGIKDVMPQFAHLPLILKPNGGGKLSKRDGDRMGFPVFPLQWTDPETKEVSSGYREAGYLPQAVINMLALLGWNPGTEQEIFSVQELIEVFSIDRISKSGAQFDPAKAKWFNHNHLVLLPPEKLAKLLEPYLKENNIDATPEYVRNVCELIADRLTHIPDLWEQSKFFFVEPEEFNQKAIKKYWKENTNTLLNLFLDELNKIEESDFNKDNLHEITKQFVEKNNVGFGQVMNPLRILIVGDNFGPGMMEIMQTFGKQGVTGRIEKSLKNI